MINVILSNDKRQEFLKNKLILDGFTISDDASIVVLPLKGIDEIGNVIDSNINFEEYLKKHNVKLVICGINTQLLEEYSKIYDFKLISYLNDEEVIIKNNYLTKEGLFTFIANFLEETILENNFLVLGYGYLGQIISKALKDSKGNVYVYAKDYHDKKSIRLNEFNNMDKFENLRGFIIINTIPSLVIDKKFIDILDKTNVIIDLSSNPGGIDKIYAKEKNIKFHHILGVPGKYFPKKSGEIIADFVKEMI